MKGAKISDFYFNSGTSCERLSVDVLQRVFNYDKVDKSAALIENNDNIPKALYALAYKWLSAQHTFNSGEDAMVSSNKEFLVLCDTHDVGSLKSFVAEVASLEEEGAVPNLTYYKVWQITYVIMACARHHPEETSSDRIEGELSEVLDI